MIARSGAAMFGLVLLVSTACGASSSSDVIDGRATDTEALPLVVENHGGSREGHTPRGFPGSGTGLFVGDNLNPSFPDGDGVQLWLTFELPAGTPVPTRSTLASSVLSTSGTPFEDLGDLQADLVSYDTLGPALFDLAIDEAGEVCERIGSDGLQCDVSRLVSSALAQGRSTIQFRLRFATAGDGDGTQDLALFFVTDSNTNESGIFTLELE